jgi:hypothetical protein
MQAPAFLLAMGFKGFCAMQTEPALDWLRPHLDRKTGDQIAHGDVFFTTS